MQVRSLQHLSPRILMRPWKRQSDGVFRATVCLEHFTTPVIELRRPKPQTRKRNLSVNSKCCLVCVGASESSASLRFQSLCFSFLQREAEREQRSWWSRTAVVAAVRSVSSHQPQKPASTVFGPVMLNELNHQIFVPRVLFFRSDGNDLIAILIPDLLFPSPAHQDQVA